MSWTKEELEKEINDRLFHFYANTDGTFAFPNSAAGDLLKLVNDYLKQPQDYDYNIGRSSGSGRV